MPKFISFIAAFALVALLAAPARSQEHADYVANISQYQAEPFLKSIPSIPQVMIVLERDWKIFYPAYSNLNDLNGDGSIDNGFNPSITYIGYFDVDSCYSHDGKKFTRDSATTPKSQDQVDAQRPAGLKANIPSPASNHGVCAGTSANGQGAARWHGNWLNFALTSRMDAIRKVLYGGKRRTDTTTQTILEPSYVPPTGMVWGGEIVADSLWNTYSAASPWFKAEDYVGVPAPQAGKMHFFARVDHLTNTWANSARADAPHMKMKLNVIATHTHPVTRQPIRYWDWAYGPAPVPSDSVLPTGANAPTSLNLPVLVEVCKNGNYSPTEGCWLYGSNLKPTGLMQQYGERGNMQFGLITSTVLGPTSESQRSQISESGPSTDKPCFNNFAINFLDNFCNTKGGVLRNHIARLGATAINPTTGIFIPGGIIDSLSKFEITGFGYTTFIASPSWSLGGNSNRDQFGSAVNSGNAVGEMAAEALRYLGGATAGLPIYQKPAAMAERLDLPIAAWNARPVDPLAQCVKPFILVISAIYPAFDGDQLPAAAELNKPVLTSLPAGSVPAGWSASAYLDKITDLEGYRTSGAQYYFAKQNHSLGVRGVCTPKNFDGSVSLANISGYCPSEPNLAGSYSLAAAAYYGHTHNFSANDTERAVDFFVVGLSPSVPPVTIEDGHGHTANIVPTVAVAPGQCLSTGTGHNCNYEANYYQLAEPAATMPMNMVNFIMKEVNADSKGVNFRIKFLSNFMTTAEPNYVWQAEHINNAEVALLTTSATPARYREALPYYINSGPFKTDWAAFNADCSPGVNPAAKIPADQPSHLACAGLDSDNAYYAFKNPDDPADQLDISEHTVVGLVVVTNTVGAGTTRAGAVGYTINGVLRPGAYLDAANISMDEGVVAASQAYPYPRAGQFRTGVPNGPGNWDAYGNPIGYGYTTLPTSLARSGNPYGNLSAAYQHYSFPNVVSDPLLTPWDCPYAGYPGADDGTSTLCGKGVRIASAAVGNINRYPGIYSTNAYYNFNQANTWANRFFTVPNLMRYIQIRSFQFDPNPPELQPRNLPNPLWLAAKYGGFKDANLNGVPDPGEWDSIKPGTPDNYFEVANLSELPGQLAKAFDRISKAGEAVTATADSITSVLGGGLAIQTSYVPEYVSSNDDGMLEERKVKVKWLGNAFSLFIDQWGNLREDSNRNGVLDVINGPTGSQGDKVVLFENQSDSDAARISLLYDEYGNNDLDDYATVASLHDLKSVWDTRKILSEMSDTALASPRAFATPTPGRRLYTYTKAGETDFASGGVRLADHLFDATRAAVLAPYVTQGYTLATAKTFIGPLACNSANALKCGAAHVPCQEIHVSAVGKPPHSISSIKVEITTGLAAGQVVATMASNTLLLRVGRTTAKGVVGALNDYIFDSHVANIVRAHLNPGDEGQWTPNAASVVLPTLATPADALDTTANIVKYTYGVDVKGWRSRTVCTPGETAAKKTWRLGDIINSKPVIVAEPAAAYDMLYGDASYSQYKRALPSAGGVRGRRIVAYLGSNDGILHAVNLGFYGSLADGTIGYQKQPFTASESGAAHTLGTELWGYVPTSVLPHLTWATDPDFAHSYYVDLEPMIVDVKNTGAARPLGDGRTWASGQWRTIMIGGLRLGGRTIELDNAAAPAKYLYSEYFALDVTDPEKEPVLLWRFSDPDLGLATSRPAVVSSTDGWHVIIGSGPTTDVVKNGVKAPVPNGGELAYDGVSNQKAKIFVLNAYTGKVQKTFGGEGNEGMRPGQSIPANSFFNDSFVTAAVGPGSGKLVTRGSDAGIVDWHNPTVYFGLTESRTPDRIDGGGLYRLQMVNADGEPAEVDDWKLTTMYKTGRPVTGAVNATYDAVGNLWVVFGTGRLWSEDDRAPLCSLLSPDTAKVAACDANHTQYLFGLKEPMNDGNLTYEEITEGSHGRKIADVSKAKVFSDGEVKDWHSVGTTTYNDILQLMSGDAYHGYKRALNIWAYTNATHPWTVTKYEMILTQPKIDPLPNGRSNMVFTTYEPSADMCDPEGRSYLYLADTYTGLPAPYMADYGFTQSLNPFTKTIGGGGGGGGGEPVTISAISGYIDAGKGQATEAWIIKGSDATIYGDTSANQVQNRIVLESTVDGFTTGVLWWREVLNLGLSLSEEELRRGLPTD